MKWDNYLRLRIWSLPGVQSWVKIHKLLEVVKWGTGRAMVHKKWKSHFKFWSGLLDEFWYAQNCVILLIEIYLLFTVTDQIDSPAGTVEPYIYYERVVRLFFVSVITHHVKFIFFGKIHLILTSSSSCCCHLLLEKCMYKFEIHHHAPNN